MWPRQTDTSTFRRHLCKTSWRCLEEVFARRLEDVLKRSWRGLGKTSWKLLEDVLKTSDQDEYIRLDQDVFWRRRQKMSSRRMFAGKLEYPWLLDEERRTLIENKIKVWCIQMCQSTTKLFMASPLPNGLHEKVKVP